MDLLGLFDFVEFVSTLAETTSVIDETKGQTHDSPINQTYHTVHFYPELRAETSNTITSARLGKNDQKLSIVTINGLVIVRMGDKAGDSLLDPSSFDNYLWEKVRNVIN